MTEVTGIIDLPKGSDGRVRQMGDGLVESPDDPFLPQQLCDEFQLRTAQEVTVEVVKKKPRRRRRSGNRAPKPVVDRV
ncbi:MAG: hypothetical protein MK085_03860, partial [Phycisphaerales bacterium]|nr:hypothetical protein [Phycisphaerales bacterium]